MEQRKVLPQCRHHPHAAVRVAESRMDVHPADEKLPNRLLIGHCELLVSASGGTGPQRDV